MEVFLVMYHVRVGDTLVEGVYSSHSKASDAIDDLNPPDPANYAIEGWTVDTQIKPL